MLERSAAPDLQLSICAERGWNRVSRVASGDCVARVGLESSRVSGLSCLCRIRSTYGPIVAC